MTLKKSCLICFMFILYALQHKSFGSTEWLTCLHFMNVINSIILQSYHYASIYYLLRCLWISTSVLNETKQPSHNTWFNEWTQLNTSPSLFIHILKNKTWDDIHCVQEYLVYEFHIYETHNHNMRYSGRENLISNNAIKYLSYK